MITHSPYQPYFPYQTYPPYKINNYETRNQIRRSRQPVRRHRTKDGKQGIKAFEIYIDALKSYLNINKTGKAD